MKLKFVKRINTLKDSIFYSLIHYNNKILGFGRKKYNSNEIIQVELNNSFDIIETYPNSIKGEDPRCFCYKNELYVLDNYSNKNIVINYKNKTSIPLNLKGKNRSFFSHNNLLYFIDYIKPFTLKILDVNTGKISDVSVVDNKKNLEYRGGTPGYKNKENEYYGYGHRTYKKDEVLKHDIFKWIIYFEKNKLPRIEHFDIEQPQNSKNICDPTSVIEIDKKKYLITAESVKPWFCKQDYVTNVYEIIE
mgnify:CR=1 FL=1